MDQLFLDLFGQQPGGSSATIVALSALSSLLTGVALLLLARRNDLGWWVQVLAVFAGPLVTALLFGYAGLVGALPAMAVAAYGLWRFSKYAAFGRFGRAVAVRGATPASVAWGFGLTAVLTALNLGPLLWSGLVFGGGTSSIWLNAFLGALITAALVGIANGFRWAWLAVAASSVGYVAVFFASAPARATLGVLVLQFGAALYGWWSWRQAPAEADAEPTETYPPHPYAE